MDKVCAFTVINLVFLVKISSQWSVSIRQGDEISNNQQQQLSHANPAPHLADRAEQDHGHDNDESFEYYDDDYNYDGEYDYVQMTNDGINNPIKTHTEDEINSAPGTGTATPDGGNDVLREHERFLRIETLKLKILHELGLTAPPIVTNSISQLPEPIIRKEEEIEQMEFEIEEQHGHQSSKLTQIANFGTEVEECRSSHQYPSQCFDFGLKADVPADNLASAELWVYKIPLLEEAEGNHTFRLSLHKGLHTKRCDHIYSKNVNIDEGWIKFDVLHKVRHWFRNQDNRTRIFEIACKSCDSNNTERIVEHSGTNRPFIRITVKGAGHHRQKRSYECSPKTVGCCRQHLKLNFQEQGWDFIRVPQEFTPNLCRGTCGLVDALSTGNIRSVFMNMSDNPTCCAPTRMSGISVLYLDEDGRLVGRVIENIVVEDCGCI